MSTTPVSSRRTFIRTAGAALSVPVAVAVSAVPAGAISADTLEARLARLEDLEAIRALNQTYAAHVNAGRHEAAAALFADPATAPAVSDVRAIAADGAGAQDVVDVALARDTATAALHGTLELEVAIEPSCPLVEMARLQGGGVVRSIDHGVFERTYVRRDGVWKIQHSTFRAAT